VPMIAIADRANVWITKYAWRGRKKDGTKCLSRNLRLAMSAQDTSAIPIDATAASAITRAQKDFRDR